MSDTVSPYIGVTGIMTAQEARAALRTAHTWASPYKVMLGILASEKTLAGMTNKWPNRYPRRERIGELLLDHPKALNLVHYTTDTPATLAAQLLWIAEFAGPHLHGFQLNMPWPDVRQLTAFHLNSRPVGKYRIVLQLGSHAIAACKTPEELADRVAAYDQLVHYVLLDWSGGKGIPLEPRRMGAYMRAIISQCPWAHLVVAGGISAARESFAGLRELAALQQHLSCDAESGLRTKEDDDLDVCVMQHYLQSLHLALDRDIFTGAMR